MAHTVDVDDPHDPRLVAYTSMTDAQLRAGLDLAHGVFVVEGITAVERLASSPYRPVSALCTPGKAAVVRAALGPCDVPVYLANGGVLEALTGFDVHRGVLALAARPPALDPGAVLAASRRVAVLEGLNDQANLGAIARSARALGIDALLLDPSCGDPLYRRTVRVSMGEMLHLPFARVTGSTAGTWADALWSLLDVGGYRAVALTPSAPTRIDDVTIGDDERVAVLLGAEGPGLSEAAMRGAAVPVRIAMAPDADSLNVGHAAAIAFWHLGRSRFR